MHKNIYSTSNEAYIALNKAVLTQGTTKSTRIGEALELKDVAFTVQNPVKDFIPESVKKIKTEYAETFWDFMISGGTDAQAAFKDYPNVAKFVDKPKSPELPDNFNTFYGPRIVEQTPEIIAELKANPDSRRAVILILDAEDRLLLDKDETLEYPCTSAITFSISNGNLDSHVHMRSQNTAVVFQLDLYLQFRLLEHMAEILGLGIGSMSFSMVNAHIYERDFSYIKETISLLEEI